MPKMVLKLYKVLIMDLNKGITDMVKGRITGRDMYHIGGSTTPNMVQKTVLFLKEDFDYLLYVMVNTI